VGGTGGAGGSAGVAQDASAARDAGAADARGGVEVAFRGDVGPYDAAVIRSSDPRDSRPLKQWLEENKYFVSEQAGKLIDDYVMQEKYFVALKLLSGRARSSPSC
jgi:hypothetical protein